MRSGDYTEPADHNKRQAGMQMQQRLRVRVRVRVR